MLAAADTSASAHKKPALQSAKKQKHAQRIHVVFDEVYYTVLSGASPGMFLGRYDLMWILRCHPLIHG